MAFICDSIRPQLKNSHLCILLWSVSSDICLYVTKWTKWLWIVRIIEFMYLLVIYLFKADVLNVLLIWCAADMVCCWYGVYCWYYGVHYKFIFRYETPSTLVFFMIYQSCIPRFLLQLSIYFQVYGDFCHHLWMRSMSCYLTCFPFPLFDSSTVIIFKTDSSTVMDQHVISVVHFGKNKRLWEES